MGKKNYIIPVLVLSFIAGLTSILHVIVGFAKTPTGMAYMWTGHYYLDYFYYLTPIAQGIRGALVAYQQGATDDGTFYPHLWPYVVLGWIGRVLNLTPIATYWIAVFILSVVLSILILLTIQNILEKETIWLKFGAFLLTLFSAPFYKIESNNLQFLDFWYSTSTFFRRFEPIPHHLLTSILVLTIFLVFSRFLKDVDKLSLSRTLKKTILICLLLVLILSFNSYNVVVPFASVLSTNFIYIFWRSKRKSLRTVGVLMFFILSAMILLGISAFVLKNYYVSTSFMSNFKSTELNLHQNPGIKLALLALGPTIILGLFGLRIFLERKSAIKILFISLFILSYVLYFSPIDKIIGTHNGRFLTPLSHVLVGSLAVLGIRQIGEFFGRFRKGISVLLFLTVFIYSAAANVRAFVDIINDRNISSPISYIPKNITLGFEKFDRLPDKGNVLLTPSQFLGTVLPVYSGRKTYVARQIVTPNYIDKNIRTSNFYLGTMTDADAYNFLKKNDLKFVVLTSIEGYDVAPLYRYPFLKEIYKNKDIVIFELTPI